MLWKKINQYYRFGVQKQFFEFNGSVKQQISGTAIDTKFALTYAWYIHGSDGDWIFKNSRKDTSGIV